MPIKNITDVKVVGSSLKKKKSVAKIDTNITEPRFVDVDKVELDKLMVTLNNLVAFKESVAKYGLTRSLVAFADHDKSLSSVIPQVPALENLASDRSVKNSKDVVVAVEGKITDVTKLISEKIKSLIEKFKARFHKKIEVVKSTVEKLDEMHKYVNKSNMVFNKDKAKEQKIYDIPYTEMLTILKETRTSLDVILKVSKFDIPTADTEFTTWISRVRSTLEPVKRCIEFFPDESGNPNDTPNCYFRISGTYDFVPASTMGYDSIEKFNTLYKELLDTLSAFEKIDVKSITISHKDTGDLKTINKSIGIISELLAGWDWALQWIKHYPFCQLNSLHYCIEEKKENT